MVSCDSRLLPLCFLCLPSGMKCLESLLVTAVFAPWSASVRCKEQSSEQRSLVQVSEMFLLCISTYSPNHIAVVVML